MNSTISENESTNLGLQSNAVLGPATIPILSTLQQSFDTMAPFAAQARFHDGNSDLASDIYLSRSIRQSRIPENESSNISVQTDAHHGPATVSPLNFTYQNLNQVTSFIPHTALPVGRLGLALQSDRIHSLTTLDTRNATTLNTRNDDLGLQADALRDPPVLPTSSDLARSAERTGPRATCMDFFSERSGLALQNGHGYSFTQPGASETRSDEHGLQRAAPVDQPATRNPLHQNLDHRGPFARHIDLSNQNSSLVSQDGQISSIRNLATSDTRFDNHNLRNPALIGDPVTLLTRNSLHQYLTGLAASSTRFDNHDLRHDTLLGPHATLHTLSPLDQNPDQAAPFALQMSHSAGSSGLANQIDQSIPIMKPVFTNVQFQNRHTNNLHTSPSIHQLHKQSYNSESLPTDLLPIYEPARAQDTAMFSSHGLVSRSSVTPLADLRYGSGTLDDRCMQEELFEPGAEYGHLPDYSRVQRKLFLVPEHEPPYDIYSERSSVLDSESESGDSFDGLFHRDGLLPQPVRLSQVSIQERSFPDNSPLPTALSFDRAPDFVSRVQDWINGIIPLSTTETTEAEHGSQGPARGYTEEDTEELLAEDDPFHMASAGSHSASSKAFRFPSDVMNTGYLALTSALNNFQLPSQQSQNTSNELEQAEVDRNRAEALDLLTRKRELSNLPETLSSGSGNDEANGTEQDLEGLEDRSRNQFQAQADTQISQDAIRDAAFQNFVDNCREFIVYQLGTIEEIPVLYPYRQGSEYIRQRLQEHFGDERIGYAMEVFREIMENHNPSVSIDEANIYASWRHDHTHRNVGPPGCLSVSSLFLKLI